MPGQDGVDGGGVEHSAHLGLIDGPFNTPAREHSGEVEDRAGDGGARDPVHDCDVKGRIERARAVDLDPLVPVTAAVGDRELDAWAVGLAQLEEVGRRPVRENGLRTAGEYGRQVPAPAGQELPRGQRVHAWVDPVQATAAGPSVGGVHADADLGELGQGEDVVLERREGRERLVWGNGGNTMAADCTHTKGVIASGCTNL